MKLHRLAASVAVLTLVLAGCDSTAATSSDLKTPAQKASYGIGLSMGKNLSQEGMNDLDSKAVALGIEDALAKKDQRISDDELMEAFGFLQARAQERMSALNDAAAKAGQAFLAENAKRDGITTTESGLQYEVIKSAEGAQPKVSDVVSVHYHGTLVDGSVFDSSIERGEPVEFPVGGVIPGWVEALQLMKVGEKYKLYIPSDLAYGAQSPTPAIPANSTLVFEVELLSIAGQPVAEVVEAIEAAAVVKAIEKVEAVNKADAVDVIDPEVSKVAEVVEVAKAVEAVKVAKDAVVEAADKADAVDVVDPEANKAAEVIEE